ncbi:MAG: ornithine cyclodeaminase family protein [Alphaproteobacteria bacterium]|jgi:alanine dehydrogenase
MTLILSNEEISQLLSIEDVLEALEEVYKDLHAGRAVTRRRSDTLVPASHNGEDAIYGFKTMDGVAPSQGFSAVRLNSDIVTWPVVEGSLRRVKIPAAPNNRWVGLVLLFSTKNGEPLAIMPDGVVQRMRVGATNGLGVKYMARENAKTVGILGSGWQAGTQLMATCAVRDIEMIKCFSPNPTNRLNFTQEMTETLGVEMMAVNSAEEAVSGVDIVLCATNSIEKVYVEGWLRPGVHVSSIKMPEIEEAALKKCDRVGLHFGQQRPDTVVAAGLEPPDRRSGKGWDVNRTFDYDACPKLPQMIAGEVKGRETENEITCFINDMGLGLQFAVTAGAAYKKAIEAGVGHELPTDWFTENVHP